MNSIRCLKLGTIISPAFDYYNILKCSVRSFSVTTSKHILYFSKKHEWVDVVDELGTVGITHYAQESLGDIVYAQLPDIGTSVEQGEECGALESVKAASEICSPVSGLIVDINNELESKPELINQSCYKDGWLFRVEMVCPEDVENLMSEDQYTEYLKTDCKKEETS